MIDIQLTDAPLSLDTCYQYVLSEDAGGLVTFVGTVRNQTKGKRVLRLEFEAYAPMAIKEMQKIAEEAVRRWPVLKISIHHRVGVLAIGEVPVIIAVACAHRKAAFEACQFAIDTLKETVPIWKKEFFEDGEVWVAAHPWCTKQSQRLYAVFAPTRRRGELIRHSITLTTFPSTLSIFRPLRADFQRRWGEHGQL